MKLAKMLFVATALTLTSCGHFGMGKGCCKKDKKQCERKADGKKCQKSKQCCMKSKKAKAV